MIGHSYFGTRRVADDVSTLVEVDGQNLLHDFNIQRDPKTGLVCSFLSERAMGLSSRDRTIVYSLDERIASCSMLS